MFEKNTLISGRYFVLLHKNLSIIESDIIMYIKGDGAYTRYAVKTVPPEKKHSYTRECEAYSSNESGHYIQCAIVFLIQCVLNNYINAFIVQR